VGCESALASAYAQKKKSRSEKLTCALPDIRSLNHGSARRRLAEGDLIHDGILLDDSAALYAKAVPSCGIVFNDGAPAISAHNLGASKHDLRLVDDIVPYH
jgi:hypothetical protein